MTTVEHWAGEHGQAVSHDEQSPPLPDEFLQADVVFLGETDHFVSQKNAFRLWWLRALSRHRPVVIGEELGWADGRQVARYLVDGDAAHLARAATFGGTGHRRDDRDDRATGVFRESMATYPHARMLAAHSQFYAELRALDVRRFFGFDVDAPGAAYAEFEHDAGLPAEFQRAAARVAGESMTEEAARLRHVVSEFDGDPVFAKALIEIEAQIDALEYTALVNPAADYEATRPAMAVREEAMKRRVQRVRQDMRPDELLVLLGHAFHLAKNDEETAEKGVGPGGGRVSSLGHHLVQEVGLRAASVWMILGGGEDCQPLVDLPRTLTYPASSLNVRLAGLGRETILPLRDLPPGPHDVGHLYGLVNRVNLAAQADAIHFFPLATPLPGF